MFVTQRQDEEPSGDRRVVEIVSDVADDGDVSMDDAPWTAEEDEAPGRELHRM